MGNDKTLTAVAITVILLVGAAVVLHWFKNKNKPGSNQDPGLLFDQEQLEQMIDEADKNRFVEMELSAEQALKNEQWQEKE